jgi:hypothetical protein
MNDAHDNAQTDQEALAKHFGGASRRSVTYMMDLIATKDYGAMEQEMPESWRSLFNYVVQLGYTVPAEQSETGKAYRTTSAVIQQSDVGKFIENLKKCSDRGQSQLTPIKQAVTEAGMYKHNDTIYKVQMAVHGSGKLYAKKLIVEDAGHDVQEGCCGEVINGKCVRCGFAFGKQYKARFDYAPGAMKMLSADERLSMEDAMAFGRLYGSCCVCGRTLTNELSIHLGIGPVCGGREFGGDFEFMLKQAKEEVEANGS